MSVAKNKETIFQQFSKEVLIAFIRKRMFMRSTEEVLRDLRSIEWEMLSDRSLALMEESIKMREGAKLLSPQWHKAEKLWQQADAMGKKADRIYKRLEEARGT